MKKIFSAGDGFPVPDGTIVHSILDPRLASQGGAAWVDEISMAMGEIPAHTTSKIHVHPVITQVTYVLSGALTIVMKDATVGEPYRLPLAPNETVVTQPGTFFQLVNDQSVACRVLYITTPAFVFDADANGTVRYNDAMVLEEDWETLAGCAWKIPQMGTVETTQQARRSQ